MNAYCPRCQTDLVDIPEEAVARGVCPSCGGQMATGRDSYAKLGIDGAVAMTFAAGSMIAAPLEYPFGQKQLHELSGGDDARATVKMPPLPPEDDGGVDVDMDAGAPETAAATTAPAASAAPSFAASDTPLPSSAFGGNTPPSGVPAFNFGSFSFGAPPTTTAEPAEAAEPAVASVSAAASQAEAAPAPFAAPTPAVPAAAAPEPAPGAGAPPSVSAFSFDLPSFPSLGMPPASSEPTPAAPSLATSAPAPASPAEPVAAAASDPVPPATAVPAHMSAMAEPHAPAAPPSADAAPGAFPGAPAFVAPVAEPGLASAAEATTPAGDNTGLPAHLQLPAIDFSMPSFGAMPQQPTAAATPSPAPVSVPRGAPSDLPAHLQLPSFPQFELPPIPGMEPAAPAPATGPAATPAPPTGLPGQPPGPPAASAPGMPPPRPPPPPRRKPKPPAPVAAAPAPAASTGSAFDLPAIGLPTLEAAQPKKKEVTLLNSEVAAELAAAPPHKRSLTPVIVVLLLVGAAVGAWFGRHTIIGLLTQDEKSTVAETAEDKAAAAFLAGKAAYDANKLDEAVAQFQAAIKFLPTSAKSHRFLAIAFAKQNKAKEAVEEYRKYLELDPKAPDAADVKKIIDDYEKAQKQKGEQGKVDGKGDEAKPDAKPDDAKEGEDKAAADKAEADAEQAKAPAKTTKGKRRRR